MANLTPAQIKAKEILVRLREKKAASLAGETLQPASLPAVAVAETLQPANEVREVGKEAMQWNEAQTRFISLGSDLTNRANRRIILTGAAGTGKTTAVKGLVQTFLIQNAMGGFPSLEWGTKRLQGGAPGIVAVSFTNKAVENVRKVMPQELKAHCLTIHKLLEFEPTFYEVYDEKTDNGKGGMRNTMRFEPKRDKERKLPEGLAVCLIDEASMVATAERDGEGAAVALFEQLEDALPHGCKIIFIGDIQQLPPVFGDSILGHSLLKIPTVELTEVYRQALDSPIIANAWRVLRGQSGVFAKRTEVDPSNPKRIIVPSFEKISKESNEKFKILPWQKKFTSHQATVAATKFLIGLAASGGYLPDEDIVLCPFNVNFGTIELNKGVAQHLGLQREAIVYEVIAGINKVYYAIGDKVMYQKDEFKILEINHNASYLGKSPQTASVNLDRWGQYQKAGASAAELLDAEAAGEVDIDSYLAAMSASDNGEDRFNHASHVITIQNIADPSIIYSLGTSGEVGALDLGYVITVHKSQGSEWRRVIILFHHTHAVMMFRELFYTAITRAREEVLIICEPDSIEKCINNPRIKGTTLEDKAAWFSAKKERKQKFKELFVEGGQ